MNWLSFIAGCGAGAVATVVIGLVTIGMVTRRDHLRAKRAQDLNERSVELLAERNAISTKTERGIAKIADWCDHNWSLKP